MHYLYIVYGYRLDHLSLSLLLLVVTRPCVAQLPGVLTGGTGVKPAESDLGVAASSLSPLPPPVFSFPFSISVRQSSPVFLPEC